MWLVQTNQLPHCSMPAQDQGRRIIPTWLLAAMALATPPLLLTGCVSMSTGGERYVACEYGMVWETALETLKDVPIDTKDKASGIIETDWVETQVIGRPYGILQREGLGDKERVRHTFTLSRKDEMTIVRLDERREHFGFRGGSRIYQWYPVEPSQESINLLISRLETRLKEEGCFVGI